MADKNDKKKLPLKKTVDNNLFAIKVVLSVSISYFVMYILGTLINASFEFLTGGFMLREVVNAVEYGTTDKIIKLLIVLGIFFIITDALWGYFWNVTAQEKSQRIGAKVEKMLFDKANSVELNCYENPKYYDKFVRAMDEAYRRIMSILQTLRSLLTSIIALTANSFLIFTIDPFLIVFAIVPFLMSFLRQYENIASHDLETAKKPLNRRVIYIRNAFYLGDYAKEMRFGNMPKTLLSDFGNTYQEYKKIIQKYGKKTCHIRLYSALFSRDCYRFGCYRIQCLQHNGNRCHKRWYEHW